MNSATKVGEIFLAAGNAYSKLGEVGPLNNHSTNNTAHHCGPINCDVLCTV